MSFFVDYASIDGNKPPDIEAAKQFGIRGAIIRGGFTMAGLAYRDPHLERDADNWRKAGCTVGSYMILGWHAPSPEDQAQNFIEAYTRHPGDLPPTLDLEADSAVAIGMTYQQALDWAHRAYDVLVEHYGHLMIYTSARVWAEVFGGLASRMAQSPLMLKIPYPYKTGQPPHLECGNPTAPEILPLPWNAPSSGGVWLKQFQGDAKGVPGFSSTVDLNVFCNFNGWAQTPPAAPRNLFVAQQLAAHGERTVRDFQTAKGLTADNVVGPVTFAAMTT